MYQFIVLLKRDVINIIKSPTLLISNSVFAFMLILILGFLNNGGYGNTGVDSYDYYGITIMLFSILNVAMTASNSFMERNLKASNMRVIFSPMPKAYIYLSKILATFLFTSVCILLNVAICHWILNVNFGGANTAYIVFLFLLFDLLMACVGVMFCCIFKSEEATNQVQSVIINILAILGGIFFQLDGLGETVRRLTYLSPVKWIIEAVFRIIYDNDLSYFLPTVLVIGVSIVALLIVCQLTFKTEDYV